MRTRRIVLSAIAASALGGLVAPPAGLADPGEVDLHAVMHHSVAYANPVGHSHYERSTAGRSVEVTMYRAYGLKGHWVKVYVNYRWVGRMWVNSNGYAHLDREAEHGQFVPWAATGDPVRVRTASGTLVISGWYHRA